MPDSSIFVWNIECTPPFAVGRPDPICFKLFLYKFSTSLVEKVGNSVRNSLGTTPIILTNFLWSVIVAMPLQKRSKVASYKNTFLKKILTNNSQTFHTSISIDVGEADDIISGFEL
jgi:hypothetical protein